MLSPEIYSPASRHILNLCKIGGFEPNIVAYCKIVPSLLMLVRCGVGIALLASDARDLTSGDICFVPITINGLDRAMVEIRIMLLWKNTNLNPAVPAFLESAKKLLEQSGSL